MKTSLVGRWRIVKMEQWDQDYVDMDSPGHITFKKDGTGQLHFGCVEAELEGTRLTGRIVFHQGDESGFAAAREIP